MDIDLAPKSLECLLPSPLIQQTTFWGRVKASLGWQPRAYDLVAATERGDVLVTVRSLGEAASLAYVPYGPEYTPEEDDRGAFLEELSERLRPKLPEDCLFIRWDLPWESPYANESDRYDEAGVWSGRPDPRFRELRMNFGTLRHAIRKAGSDILPPDTMIVDLGGSDADLLGRMRPKTRYNIGLAQRRGVAVRGGDAADMPIWERLYAETARRNGIRPHGVEHFAALLSSVSEEDDTSVRLLIAEDREGESLAALFLAISGGRATYLYGASSSFRRELMAPYALQWAAMRAAREAGCRSYDLFGCAPGPEREHPLYGLYRFKVGFGGASLHRQGCWDYPFDPEGYGIFRASEAVETGFHGGSDL